MTTAQIGEAAPDHDDPTGHGHPDDPRRPDSKPSGCPAGGPAAGAGPSNAADDCAGLEEQRKALDDEQHASDERFKDDPDAKKAAHDRIDAQKHALDDQLKACH